MRAPASPATPSRAVSSAPRRSTSDERRAAEDQALHLAAGEPDLGERRRPEVELADPAVEELHALERGLAEVHVVEADVVESHPLQRGAVCDERAEPAVPDGDRVPRRAGDVQGRDPHVVEHAGAEPGPAHPAVVDRAAAEAAVEEPRVVGGDVAERDAVEVDAVVPVVRLQGRGARRPEAGQRHVGDGVPVERCLRGPGRPGRPASRGHGAILAQGADTAAGPVRYPAPGSLSFACAAAFAAPA